jgi:uncharacterized membrane protein YheB (UPF0754 family)
MNPLIVISPAGSGMNFAMEALNLAYKGKSMGGGHIKSDIREDVKQVAILRNPYDAVASGSERWINTSGHKDFADKEDRLIDISDTKSIIMTLDSHSREYINFFKDIELMDNVKLFSFEFITNNHIQFIEEVGKFFGMNPDRSDITVKDIFDNIDLHENRNRRPRETTEARKVINNLIQESYTKDSWEAWKIYSTLKAKLDNEGL